jgi:Skp family chaperone for outer membrane proteins
MLRKQLLGMACAGTLLLSCGGKNEKDTKHVDSTPKVENSKMGDLKIAFYDQDSLKVKFSFYKEQDSIVTQKQLAFQKSLERKQKELETYYAEYVRKAQNKELSPNQDQGYQMNLQRRQEEMMQFRDAQGIALEKETIEKLEVIGNKIEAYSKQYCELHGIDILLVHAKGGQFNYIKPSMDITKEFTAFLNQKQEEIEAEIKK